MHVLGLPPAFVLSQDQTLKLTPILKMERSSSKASHHAFLARCSDLVGFRFPARRRLRIPSLRLHLSKSRKPRRIFFFSTAASSAVPSRFVAGGRFILTPRLGVNIFFFNPPPDPRGAPAVPTNRSAPRRGRGSNQTRTHRQGLLLRPDGNRGTAARKKTL